MIRTDLNTLPSEVVSIIIRILDYESYEDDMSDEIVKELCNYSRISPRFTYYAQEAIYSSLIFETNEQIIEWLKSDATLRGTFKTQQLIFSGGPFDLNTLSMLMAAMNNQEGFLGGSRTLDIKIDHSIPDTFFMHEKLKGVKILMLGSPVTETLPEITLVPFQIKNLIIELPSTGSNNFIKQLFTDRLDELVMK